MRRLLAALLLVLFGRIAGAGAQEHLGKHVALSAVDGTSHVFRLDRYIGQGWYDETYQASDVASGEKVAVKILRSVHGAAPDSYDAQTDILRRASHKHLPRPYGVGLTQDGRRAMVMEYVEGDMLGKAFADWPVRPRGKAVRITMQILRAARSLEKIGVRHNDIHPENVRLFGAVSKTVKLLDVGNATSVAQGSTGGLQFYNAPTHGAANDDVYSAGAILIQLLTGKASLAALPLIKNPDVRRIAEKATHPQVSARYQTAQEMIDALRPYRGTFGRNRR